MNRPESFRLRWLEADDHIRAGQLGKALRVFEALAVDGYTEAYVEIGNILEEGKEDEIPQDFDAARSWYMKAVEKSGDPYAYIGLARLAINGYTEAGTISDAVEYLDIAANAHSPVALTMLGALYHAGQLVPKDRCKASELYEKALAHGYVLPMAYLAKLNWERGHYLDALRLRLKAIWAAYNLARNDHSDPRLWNYLP